MLTCNQLDTQELLCFGANIVLRPLKTENLKIIITMPNVLALQTPVPPLSWALAVLLQRLDAVAIPDFLSANGSAAFNESGFLIG